jgi:hypothetical protein
VHRELLGRSGGKRCTDSVPQTNRRINCYCAGTLSQLDLGVADELNSIEVQSMLHLPCTMDGSAQCGGLSLPQLPDVMPLPSPDMAAAAWALVAELDAHAAADHAGACGSSSAGTIGEISDTMAGGTQLSALQYTQDGADVHSSAMMPCRKTIGWRWSVSCAQLAGPAFTLACAAAACTSCRQWSCPGLRGHSCRLSVPCMKVQLQGSARQRQAAHWLQGSAR